MEIIRIRRDMGKTPRSKVITDRIFLVDYYGQRGGTLQSAIDKFAKLIQVPSWEVAENDNRRGHFTAHSSHKAGCIWLHEKSGTGIITHEVCHATHHLLKGLLMENFTEVDEVFAHYSGWLATQIVKKLF